MKPLATIDTDFDVNTDTPAGKDPDTYSPTLRRYHQLLWSKALPNGGHFRLTDQLAGSYLTHRSELGELVLSSDAISSTFMHVSRMANLVAQVPKGELLDFYRLCSTIGGYIIFPARKVDRKMTINGARGLNSRIGDRFDLTLECIRRHYASQASPLAETLERYSGFFDLFGDFGGYVDFFLLQDLSGSDRASVNFFLPFQSFDTSPYPKKIEEYEAYRKSVIRFVRGRNDRIVAWQQEAILTA